LTIHPPNILLIWDRLGDYHRARVRALQEKAGESIVVAADLGAADLMYGWESNPDEEFYAALSHKPVEQPDFRARCRSFVRLVKFHQIKVVGISGYGRKEYIAFLILAKLLGLKTILFAESWYARSSFSDKLKGLFLSIFCHGFLVSGIRAKEHFIQNLKINPNKIKTGYSVVDNEHFTKKAKVEKKNEILCIARFSPEKNLGTLISAFTKSKISETYTLRLIGGGKEHDKLQEIAGNKPIIFENWLSYNQLPNRYRQARVFVLPSIFEPWGLVVNEAMAAGLPIIASVQCGCQPDLVSSENGFTFDAENEESLIKLFDQIADLPPEKLEQKGFAGKEIIKGFTPESWAEQFLKLSE
jgi:1,2-diacylglycerol 3-alpha-glucosyltransferase